REPAPAPMMAVAATSSSSARWTGSARRVVSPSQRAGWRTWTSVRCTPPTAARAPSAATTTAGPASGWGTRERRNGGSPPPCAARRPSPRGGGAGQGALAPAADAGADSERHRPRDASHCTDAARSRILSLAPAGPAQAITPGGVSRTTMSIPLSSPGAAYLECTRCGRSYETERLWRVSPCCSLPLYARYDLDRIRPHFRPADLRGRRPDVWRYAEVLPVRRADRRLTLGEGFTPLVDAPRLADALGLERVWIKDEGQNPTGSFKARGLALAVARAWELGASDVAIPSAGNAGSAAAAYAAAAGLAAHVVVPADTPRAIVEEIRGLGAELALIDGLITDAAVRVAAGAEAHGWFDLSTLKEPYRVEGKKTMGYELF